MEPYFQQRIQSTEQWQSVRKPNFYATSVVDDIILAYWRVLGGPVVLYAAEHIWGKFDDNTS